MACPLPPQEGYPRTFNEIVPIANASKKDIGRCYKLIVKVLKVDMKDMGVIHASDYMRRFCNSLGMSNQDTKAATEMVNVASPKVKLTPCLASMPFPRPPLRPANDHNPPTNSSYWSSSPDCFVLTDHVAWLVFQDGRPGDVKHSWDGRSPISIAAAVIYIITMLPKCTVSPPLVDITNVSRVAEGTIRAAYKDLYPERHHLVPSWFATPGELDALPPPATKS